MKNTLIIILSLALAYSCNTKPKVDLNAEKEAITRLENKWPEFFKLRNADSLMTLYAPDAVSIGPDHPTSGNSAEHIKAILNDTTVLYQDYSAVIDKIDISASGDMAYATGHDETPTKSLEGTVVVKMRFVDVWKKINGNWKIVMAIATK